MSSNPEGNRSLLAASAALLLLAFAAYSATQALHTSGLVGEAVALLSGVPREHGVILFLIAFVAVSLPFAWGYMLANIGAGYVYGFTAGLAVVVCGALAGAYVGTRVSAAFFHAWIDHKVNSHDLLRAVRRVMTSPHKYRLVLLMRLSPVPFGLQNAVFALTPGGLDQPRYLAYTAAGLLPTQVLNTYIGSTLGGVEEVFADRSMDLRTYMTYAAQCAAGVVLTAMVFYKARTELHHATRDLPEPDVQLV